MRIFTLMLLASLPLGLMAQKKGELNWPDMKVDPSTNLITYTDVPEVPGVSATDQYDRAIEWIKGYYKNYAEKLRKSDREGAEIEVFGRFPIFAYDNKGVKTNSRQGLIQYTLSLRFRDGRYKYELTKLNYKATSYQPLEAWLDREHHDAYNHSFYLTDIDAELNALIADMKRAIASAPEEKKDDW